MLNFGIKRKMVFLVLAVLIPLFAAELVRLNIDLHEKINSAQNENNAYARSMVSIFNSYVDDLWKDEAVIGDLIVSRSNTAQEDLQEYMLKTEALQDKAVLFWISPDGIILAGQDPELTGGSVSDSSFFVRMMSGEDKVISDLVPFIPNDKQAIIVARRIEKDGELQGILAGRIDSEAFSQRLSHMSDMLRLNFSFTDKNGSIFYRNTAENKFLPDTALYTKQTGGEDTVDIIDELIPAGSAGSYFEYPVGLNGWKCFVKDNYNSILEEYNIRLKYDIAILAAVTIFSLALAMVMAKKTLSPLMTIKNAVSAVKRGDYSVRSNIYGGDELAVTAQAIDNMVDSIYANDRMKTRFFTDLSHELKTPLNVIFSSAQLIESILPSVECENKTKILKQIRSIRQNCYRLIKIISNLIDVSKYDSGYLTANMENHNIISILEDITMSIVNYAENKGVNIVFDTDTEEKFMACDPNMIERIMLNLLSNALKFTDRGGRISVDISCKMDRVIVIVSDTGIGIPYDKLDHIFERFRQVESSLDRNRYGSGIGLSLVKSLIEVHNGTIYVSSEPGKGTRFTLHLPVTIMPAAASKIHDESSKGSEKSDRSLADMINIEFSDIVELE